jgi:hypothetical protein
MVFDAFKAKRGVCLHAFLGEWRAWTGRHQRNPMEGTMGNQTGARIVGTQGDGWYLIQLADGRGQVANTNRGRLSAPRPLDSLLARGDWVRCEDVDLAEVLAQVTVWARLRKLLGMLSWAVLDGRFEADDDHRIPVRRALTFALADANILGDVGIKKSPCGCQRRFGRVIIICWPHAGLDD